MKSPEDIDLNIDAKLTPDTDVDGIEQAPQEKEEGLVGEQSTTEQLFQSCLQ